MRVRAGRKFPDVHARELWGRLVCHDCGGARRYWDGGECGGESDRFFPDDDFRQRGRNGRTWYPGKFGRRVAGCGGDRGCGGSCRGSVSTSGKFLMIT